MNQQLIVAEEANMLWKMANAIGGTEFVPQAMRGRVPEVYAALLFGREVGLSPMASVQNVAVINGKPSLWGDGALAVVQAHPLYEWHRESTLEEIRETGVATCTIKRKGNPEPFVRQFDVDAARKAKLWGRSGPWSSYPERMLQMRARGYALRDAFADGMKGLSTAEEAGDYANPRAARPVEAPAPAPVVIHEAPALPAPVVAQPVVEEPQKEPAPAPVKKEARRARRPRKAERKVDPKVEPKVEPAKADKPKQARPKPSPHVVEAENEAGAPLLMGPPPEDTRMNHE